MVDELLVDDVGAVRVITLNRPAARNAINAALAAALGTALDELDGRDDLSVGVIATSSANFCAGMDLKAFLSEGIPLHSDNGFAGIAERRMTKPLVAAVEGYALAGGFEIALSCDLIVAAIGAQFGLPEVKRGLVAAAGGLIRLPQRLPYHLAMSLVLTGEMLDAATAHQHGLVTRLCQDGESRSRAIEVAMLVAGNAPLAVRASKRVVSESGHWPPDEAFARQAAITDPIFMSVDAQEGPVAFAERRLPKWSGR